MRPLDALDRGTACALRGLLFDLDDTLLTHGVLTRAAYGALWDLKDAGFGLVAVTGRPTGWGEVIVRQWPIDAAIAENGAIAVVRDGPGVSVSDPCDAAERSARRLRLSGLVETVRATVPEARLTGDGPLRRSDVAWDVGERERLPDDRVAAIERAARDAGATTTLSSVHLHATFDPDDKASGAVRVLRALCGEEASAVRSRWAFAGDSGNDRACFAAFGCTFGVANVRSRLATLSVTPRFIARAPMGEGFAEIARALLAARRRA